MSLADCRRFEYKRQISCVRIYVADEIFAVGKVKLQSLGFAPNDIGSLGEA